MKRRILSIFCVLALCLGLLPTTALAANDPVTYLTWSEEQSKLVTDTCDSYTSLTSSSNISSLGTEGQQKWYVLKGNNSRRFRIEVKGDVHLILSNNCTLTAQQGIHVTDGSSLTIYAQSEDADAMGKLVALSGDDYLTYRYCAVIGGNGTDTAGSITINGGNITATGKSDSGAYGAAIGTGCYSTSGSTDSTMAITINGGIVTAEATGGGAAIGTGYRTGGGTITINGGTINATSNGDGAAIGTGYTGNGGTISINGGTVQATSNNSGAAIGVGDSGTLGTVNITGGQITAAALNQRKASESGAAIGCGYFYKTDGKIYISGGTINITAGYLNGIGYGHYKSSTSGSSSITITITGGSICNPYQMGGTPVNGSGVSVYKTKVDLSDVGGIAANQAVSGTIKDYSYGFDDVYIDANTCLYLYLPAGETTATFGGQTFEGTVSAGDGNVLTASNAAKAPVSYIDKTGQQYSTKYYTEVTDATSTWTTGWYVVSGNTTISNRIEVTGNVSLILTDGAILTASAGIHVPETASLDICGQSGGTGKLKANAGDGNAAIGGNGGTNEATGTISICSGTVEATGGIGGGANCYNGTNTRGTVAIYGGTITATGGTGGAGIGTGVDGQINNIILAGGTIEANGGGDSAQDIGMGSGTSTLNSVMEFDAGGEGFGDDGGEPVLQSISGSETNYRYDLDIRGGSIYTSGGTEAVTAPDPYNSNYGELAVKNKIVYYAEADFGAGYANQPVSGTLTVDNTAYQYSFNGVKTDANGKLHLYTFGGSVKLTADNGYTFEGTINATNSTLTPQQSPLSGSISISGTVQCGETLTVNTGSVMPEDAAETLSYAWYRCEDQTGTNDTQISGAAGSTYTLTVEDAGKYIKVEATSTEYSGTLSAMTSQVQKAPATVSTAPAAKDNLVYNGSAQVLVTAGNVIGGTMQYSTEETGSYSTTIPTGTDAGNYSVWYYVKGDENHSDTQPMEVKVTIAKATPAYTVPTDLTATYGDTLADVTLTSGWTWDAPDTPVGNVGDNTFSAIYTPSDTTNYNTVTENLTVTVSAKDITDAVITLGDALTYTGQQQTQQIASVTVGGLAVTTYEISGNTGTDAGDYTLTVTGTGNFTGTTTKGWSIAKAIYTGTTGVSGAVLANYSGEVTLPAIPTGASFGEVSYSGSDLSGLSISEKGVLSYTGGSGIVKDQTYTITVPVNGGKNYNNYEITVTLTGTDKRVLTITGVTAQDGTYNGQAQTGYTGSPAADGYDGDFTVTYDTTDGKAPTDAGTYTVTIAIPEDNAQYVGSMDLQFTIAPKALTVSVPSPSVYVGDSAPELALTYTGLVDGERVTPSEDPVFTITKSDGTEITLTDAVKTAGTYTITWSNAGDTTFTGDENYAIQTVTAGTLTVSVRSSGGGGGSSSNITTETTKNPDGSTTTTVTNKNTGTVTETTTWPDGSKEVIETKKDGTVTTTTTDTAGNQTAVVEKPDGSSQTTVSNKDGSGSVTLVDADGNIISQATLSEAAVAAAQEKGEAVTLPMPEVPVTTDRETAPTVTVDLPVGGSVKVEIPVEDVTPGTVAVLVKSNGDEEIIKTSVTTGSGVTVTLNDGDTVKIVDNSRDFADVPDNYWGAEAVDFAVSRELFAGTSATTFAPDTAMTRAMIVTVLARFEGVDTTTGSTWYEAGQQWAMENGVSDGTNMDASLTREQLATMLYRYAQSKGYDTTQGGMAIREYADFEQISDYAVEAMTWAVNTGLISGTSTTTLSPQGLATRAQVATILMRFIEGMA